MWKAFCLPNWKVLNWPKAKRIIPSLQCFFISEAWWFYFRKCFKCLIRFPYFDDTRPDVIQMHTNFRNRLFWSTFDLLDFCVILTVCRRPFFQVLRINSYLILRFKKKWLSVAVKTWDMFSRALFYIFARSLLLLILPLWLKICQLT